MSNKEKFRACLLGGAIGDALGYPIEFIDYNQIKSIYGNDGVTDLLIDNNMNKAVISDDTQMTLFTADGLAWAYLVCRKNEKANYAGSGVYQSYLRWLYMQTGDISNTRWLSKDIGDYNKTFILDVKALHAQRDPGNTCLSALESGVMGTIDKPINNSNGCGGVMRVAPVGLLFHQYPEFAFKVACEVAAITHGHPSGYLSAGVLAVIIAEILNGKKLEDSIHSALEILVTYEGFQETLRTLLRAIDFAGKKTVPSEAIPSIGEGWIADEALAIGIYCSMKEPDFKKALLMSVNHNGDSDSTGSICGNIMGALLGMAHIPDQWLDAVEIKEFITEISDKLFVTYEFQKKECSL